MFSRVSRRLSALVVVAGLTLVIGPQTARAAADTTSPTLSAFSRSGNAGVSAPATINVSYTATDDASGSGLDTVSFTYDRPDGGSFAVSDSDTGTSGGLAAGALSQWAADGAYTLAQISVVDLAGNRTDYFRDGTTLAEPSGVSATHALDFAQGDFSVTNPSEDITVPSLTSVTLSSSPTVAAGSTVSLGYVATDAASGISTVTGLAIDGVGDSLELSSSVSGTLSGTLPTTQAGGAFHLVTVTLTDVAGNTAVYDSGGLVTKAPSASSGPDSHALDFGAVAFTVPPVATAINATLSTSVIAYPGTAKLGGKLLRKDLNQGMGGTALDIQSRKHGTSTWSALASVTTASDGSFSLIVRPTATSDYRVLLPASEAFQTATSNVAVVQVRVLVAGSLTSSSVRHGRSVALYGSVAPSRAGQLVALQRYYSGAWHTVASARLDGSSNYAFVITPATVGRLQYRVYKATEPEHLANASPTRVLSVT